MSETRQQKIIHMFDEIADTYDVTNRVLSLGLDVSWRKKGCDLAFEHYGARKLDQIVDIACGTGDMILHWQNQAKKRNIGIQSIHGIDPSSGMLEVARKKVDGATFTQAEAKELPLEDSSADMLSIAYGIRNVVERLKAFEEFHRVLKPGGILMILEFTKNENNTYLQKLTNCYLRKALPVIGGIVSKNYRAYKYLPDSIEEFLTKEMMEEELRSVGFDVFFSKGYSNNISTLMLASKK